VHDAMRCAGQARLAGATYRHGTSRCPTPLTGGSSEWRSAAPPRATDAIASTLPGSSLSSRWRRRQMLASSSPASGPGTEG
jgi:hypothetical protein